MNLKRRLISGTAWSTSTTLANQLANLATLAVVARQVDAAAFGTVAIVLISLELTREVATSGLPDYLIRSKRWDDVLASSALIYQLLVASILASTMALVGVLLHSYGPATLGLVFVALSPTYVLEGAAVVFGARIQHELRFRVLTSSVLLGGIVGAAAAISSSLLGAGLWALVLGRLVAAGSVLALLAWRARWKPTWRFHRSLWSVLPRSSRLAGANTLGVANLRITDFIVGSVAGAATLGLYQIAGKGLDLVLATVVAPGQRVALSGFAALPSREQMAVVLVRVLRASSIVAFPVFVGLSALSMEFLEIAFGDGWDGAAAPMSILTLVGAPALITSFLAPVLTALDRTNWLFSFALAMVLLSAAVAMVTAQFGIESVALGFLGRSVLGAVIAMLIFRVLLSVSLVGLIVALVPACSSALVMYVAVSELRDVTDYLGLYLQTAVLVLSGAAAYIGTLALLWRSALRQLHRDLTS